MVLLDHTDTQTQHDETLCPGTSVPGTAAFMVKLSTPALLRESSIFCLLSSAAGCWRHCSAAACRSSASLTKQKPQTHHPLQSGRIYDYRLLVCGSFSTSYILCCCEEILFSQEQLESGCEESALIILKQIVT